MTKAEEAEAKKRCDVRRSNSSKHLPCPACSSMSLSLRCSPFFLLPPTCTRGDLLSQRPWTQEEDDTVRRLVAEQRGVDGANRWAEIAKYLRSEWQAMPRALAQSARPGDPQGRLDGRGGCHFDCEAGVDMSRTQALGRAGRRRDAPRARARNQHHRTCMRTIWPLASRVPRTSGHHVPASDEYRHHCQRFTRNSAPCKLFAPPPTSSSIVPLDVLTRSLVRTLVYCPLSPLPSLASPLRAPPTVARGRRNSAISGPRSRNSFPVAPTTRSKTTGTRG